MPDPQPERLRIAILGGGLAGAAAFISLAKHGHLDVHIFESAPAFREEGAGVFLNATAVRALEHLSLRHHLAAAGAVPMRPSRAFMGQGPDRGRHLIDVGDEQAKGYNVKRSALLRQLYQDVEPERMHTGKKLVRIEQREMGGSGIQTQTRSRSMVVWFEDGSCFDCDVVLGADGIHSTTRRFVLPEGHASVGPKFAGWWVAIKLVPFARALASLGPEIVDLETPRQVVYVGRDSYILCDWVDDKTNFQCIVVQAVSENTVIDVKEWKKMMPKADFVSLLEGFDPQIEKGMAELFFETGAGGDEEQAKEDVAMLSLCHHGPAPAIVKGSIGLLGDAAGTTTPWQGSGSCMVLQDALLLSELFAHVKRPDEAGPALLAYDLVQLPNRERLIASSNEVGRLCTGGFPGVGMDCEKLIASLKNRWDWILELDPLGNRDKALDLMQQTLRGGV